MKQIYCFNTLELVHTHDEKNVSKDVIFFKNRHKHILEIKTTMLLEDDETLDNYLFRKYIEQILSKVSFDIEKKTYEMLAKFVRNRVIEQFTNHNVIIDIKEDNNNGFVFNFDELEPNI